MDKTLEMIVDVRRPDSTILTGAWVISSCVEQGGKIKKRWIEPFRNDKIHCGLVGFFDGDNPDEIDSDSFHKLATYWDAEYDIAKVSSVFKNSFFGDEYYDSWHYNVYSPKNGFGQFYPGSFYYDVARADNVVLLDKNGSFIANLTAQENIYDLCNGHNLQRYNLRAIHDIKGKIIKYNTAKYPYEYAGIPAVILGKGVCKTPGTFVFVPQHPNITKIDIINEGVWQPIPRPSDVVLLQATKEKDEFVLEKNLTLNLQINEMDQKFDLAEHQYQLRSMYENAKNAKEHE